MTPEEIFKDKPELLNTPEVKKLILTFTDTFEKTALLGKRYQSFYYEVLDEIIYSDTMIKNGKKSEEVVKSILELIDKF